MIRTVGNRVDSVWRVVEAAQRVAAARAVWVDDLVRTTGLSPQGIQLGFDRHLETNPTQSDIAQLVACTQEASLVHVVLSSNVFTAALRALAIARASSSHVRVRPSRSDPTFARALIETLADPHVEQVETIAPETIVDGEIHVYGRDETIASIRQRAQPNVIVRGHGTGLGVALVFASGDLDEAAENLAMDMIAFDQRGCMSPRVACVEGTIGHAEKFATALSSALNRAGMVTPRGALMPEERAEAARYGSTMQFVGTILSGTDHVIGVAGATVPLSIPPPGRHLHIAAVPGPAGVAPLLVPLARFVVVVGSNDTTRAKPFVPPGARLSQLGQMQTPPLDGPVDRRAEGP